MTKYSFSDLAQERLPDLKRTTLKGVNGLTRTDITLDSRDRVATLHVPRLSPENLDALADAMCTVLLDFCGSAHNILFVGLGNADFSCDAVGVRAAIRLNPTRLLKDAPRKLSVLIPGVSGNTGLDTVETVTALVDRLHPDLVLSCDALAARDPSHLGATVQLTTAGISPASGIGADSLALNRGTLGCDTVSIGVPTVVRAGVLAADIISGDKADQKQKRPPDGKLLSSILQSPLSNMIVAPKNVDAVCTLAATAIARSVMKFVGFDGAQIFHA